MKQYLSAMKFILKNGIKSEDRTGEGTLSYFGYQMRFNLSEGFPAVTTKKLAWKSVLTELVWFLEGSSDERRLAELLHGTRSLEKTTIWTPNAKNQGKQLGYQDNELGPVYGYHWRFMYNNECFPVKEKKSKYYNENNVDVSNKSYNENNVYGVGIVDVNKKLTSIEKRLKLTWEKMISSCYNKDDKLYSKNKENNVIVCDRWLSLSNFIKDAQELEGWLWYKREKNIVLYRNYYGINHIYAPDTTVFVPSEHAKKYESSKGFIAVKNPEFPTRYFISEKEYKLTSPLGKKTKYENKGFVIRHQFPVDQIANLIKNIKEDPYSRRLLLTSLDVGSVSKATLPPCHTFAQFYVRDGKLSCQLYQRSADFFLGVPFNIASYALLVHILAKLTNLEVGELVHTFGDAHIYLNHIEAVQKQIKRKPHKLPQIKINENLTDINNIKVSDFELVNYVHRQPIKAPMAV